MYSAGLSTRFERNLTAYSFLVPWIFGVVILTVGSMLYTVYLGFTHYDLISPPRWIGIGNFASILRNQNFWDAVRATTTFVVIALPLRITVSLLLAILLSKRRRGVGIYRAVIYLPSLIGGSVGIAIGWQRLFSPNGPINTMLSLAGIKAPDWLGSPRYAIVVLIVLSCWQLGSEMVIFIAGLKQVPDHLYESARIDGASGLRRFFRITIPMISPIIFFNLIVGTINTFVIFTQVYVITGGGPMNSTLFYALYIYQQAFLYLHMGFAAALAIILLGILASISGILFLTQKYWVNYDV